MTWFNPSSKYWVSDLYHSGILFGWNKKLTLEYGSFDAAANYILGYMEGRDFVWDIRRGL